MQRVEQHIIKRSDPRFAPIDAAAFKAKNLYNAALYLVRQAYIFEGRYLGYEAVYHQMKGHEAYRALPTKVAQQILRLLDKNWQSYFAACQAYQEDPSRFRKHPKMPHYKQKRWRQRESYQPINSCLLIRNYNRVKIIWLCL